MHLLRIVRRIIEYPSVPPSTPLKTVLMLLGLAVVALALTGSCVVLVGLVIGLGEKGGDQFDEADLDAERWSSIHSDFGYPVSPKWTPDGSVIYIETGRDRELSTYVVSSDGSELKELKHVVRPHVSPDGSRMVYSTWRDTGKYSYDIETAKPDGSDRRRLTKDSAYIDIAPSWSPDGSRIAFARVKHQSQGIDPGTDKRGIYVMAADGSGLRRVYRLRGSLPEDLDAERFQSGPVWSLDGETLAFAISELLARRIPGKKDVLYTIGADGSNLAAVYDDNKTGDNKTVVFRVRSPAWSPDGGRLAFGYDFPYIVNTDGTGLRKAANIGLLRSASWSPDGTRLLVVGSGLADHYGISAYVAEANGGGHRRLGNGVREARGAAWSPDGSRVAIVEEHEINTQYPAPYLQTMAPDGSDVQVLLERRKRFGELKATNPADGWKWPWQR